MSPLAELLSVSRASATITNVSPILGKNFRVAILLDGRPCVSRSRPRRCVAAFGSPPPPAGSVSRRSTSTHHTRSLAAIEFYAGPATMPPELMPQGSVGRW